MEKMDNIEIKLQLKTSKQTYVISLEGTDIQKEVASKVLDAFDNLFRDIISIDIFDKIFDVCNNGEKVVVNAAIDNIRKEYEE